MAQWRFRSWATIHLSNQLTVYCYLFLILFTVSVEGGRKPRKAPGMPQGVPEIHWGASGRYLTCSSPPKQLLEGLRGLQVSFKCAPLLETQQKPTFCIFVQSSYGAPELPKKVFGGALGSHERSLAGPRAAQSTPGAS